MKTYFETRVSPLKWKEIPVDFILVQNSCVTVKTTVESLARALRRGQSFVPSVFKGKNSRANFISTQVFVLAFDNNQNPEEKIKLFEGYGIRPNIVYYSFSHQENFNKFRLVFILDTLITNLKTRDKIQLALMNIAKDSTQSYQDVLTMCLGTNGLVVVRNKSVNTFSDVLPAIDIFINTHVRPDTRITNTIRFKNLLSTNKNSVPRKIEYYKFLEARYWN